MKRTALVTGIASTLLAFAVHAESSPKPSFESLDVDGDGRISAAEAAAHEELSSKLASLDTDGDGAISRAEFETLKLAEASATTSSTPDASSDYAQPEADTQATQPPDTEEPPSDSAAQVPPTA